MKQLLMGLLLSVGFTGTLNAAVNKEGRVLVVVSELQTHGSRSMRGLYDVLERLTVTQTGIILRDDYKQVVYLKGQNARADMLKNVLLELASRPSVRAIDMVIALHGSNGALYFREGRVDASVLAARIMASTNATQRAAAATLHRKLRMVYNTSCFGRSHNQAFIDMGFDVSVGSNGINANAEFEFGPSLTAWSFGWKWVDAFGVSNNDAALFTADQPVRMVGINADSKKFFRGSSQTKIDSDPLN